MDIIIIAIIIVIIVMVVNFLSIMLWLRPWTG
jgi:uncharacterized membrane protein